MPTIVEVLRLNLEPVPEWLANKSPPSFDPETLPTHERCHGFFF